MKLNKKKKGFTLIELMAVIAIVAILAAVLVPTVNGYITRAKKMAVINQARTIVNAVESYNITSSAKIDESTELGTVDEENTILNTLEAAGLFDKTTTKTDSLPDDVKYKTLKEINETEDALDKITLDGKELDIWSGTNEYPED